MSALVLQPIQRGLPWSHSQPIDSPQEPRQARAQLRESQFGRLLPLDQQPAAVSITPSTARPNQYRLGISVERTTSLPLRVWLELFVDDALIGAGSIPFTRL